MTPISLDTIRQVVRGSPLTSFDPSLPIHAVCTDTRAMKPSSLFVALKGDNFDAHDFLDKAIDAGAVAILVERSVPLVASHENIARIQVPSTRRALGQLARHLRDQFASTVIAVAGSNGKTSTKHLIDSALRRNRTGSMSPKSFNNDIGVPLTIFAADGKHDYLVLEMGTNHPGEIRTLTQIGRPDVAVITNCSAEHLEFLGDLDGVRAENGSLIEGLSPGGLLIVNGDDPALLSAVAGWMGKRITFGFHRTNTLFATDVRAGDDGVRFRTNDTAAEWFVPLLGRHTASNALAAIAVARHMGLTETEVRDALAAATGAEMRLQLQNIAGVSVLNDAYNANPASMKAALETLGTLPSDGRRIAVLGDMRELGESSERYHRELGHVAAQLHLDVLACVGKHARFLASSAAESGMNGQIHCFDDSSAASKVVPTWLRSGDVILLKGSRGVKLELIVKEIGAALSPAA